MILCVLNVHGLSSGGISSLVLTAIELDLEGLFRVVDDLSFNWNVLVLLDFPFSGNILNSLLGDVLRNVLSQIFNGVIVGFSNLSWNALDSLLLSIFSHSSGLWHSLHSHFILIFDDFLLEWNILNSALALDHFFPSVNSGVDNLGSLHKSLVGTRTGITLVVASGGVSSLIDVTSCV